ncbi:hypothetical protein PENSPDRAFT_259570 [Peniophora sp. CONT]|nr:hypothetical protein PENSPDRAFT_259570 [Peniophora sp. CONT]
MRLLLEPTLLLLVLPLLFGASSLLLVTRTRGTYAANIWPQRWRRNRARECVPRRRQHTIPSKLARPWCMRHRLRTRSRPRLSVSMARDLHEAWSRLMLLNVASLSRERRLAATRPRLAHRRGHDTKTLSLCLCTGGTRTMRGSARPARSLAWSASTRERFVLAALGLIALDACVARRFGAAALQLAFCAGK